MHGISFLPKEFMTIRVIVLYRRAVLLVALNSVTQRALGRAPEFSIGQTSFKTFHARDLCHKKSSCVNPIHS